MKEKNISVAAIQETKLTAKSNFPFNHGDYSIIRKDRNTGGGGLAFIIENSIKYKTTTLPPPKGWRQYH